MRDLLDNAAQVRTMVTEDAYTCLLAQQSSGKIAVSAPDDDLRLRLPVRGGYRRQIIFFTLD